MGQRLAFQKLIQFNDIQTILLQFKQIKFWLQNSIL